MSENQNAPDQNKSFAEKPQKSKRGSFRNLLRPPTLGDLNKDRIANIQNTILLAMLSLNFSFTLFMLFTNGGLGTILLLLGFASVFIFALVALRRGYLGPGSWILVGSMILVSIQSLMASSFSALSMMVLAVALLLAGILFRPIVVLGVSILTMAITASFLFFKPSSMDQSSVIVLFMGLGMISLLMILTSHTFQQAFAQADRSNQHLTQVNRDLQNITTNLEQRVNERTKVLSQQALQLLAATEVSRAASSVLDSDELMRQAVNLVRDRFDLYYVGLFMLSERHHFAILKAGTGEAGRKLLESGHKLEINDDSMIGWCIHHKEARIALSVGEEAVHFSNPLLPNTRSELALPLIAQGQVIGAMSVQSEHESAFSPEDITILQTLADQLANGIEKARLYLQIQLRAIELDKAREVADRAKEEAENARLAVEEANRSLATQMWQTAGQAALNEKMRGEQDVATLAQGVIQHLCKYLEIYSGAVYILEDKQLRLTGTYALRRKAFAQEYKLGEDLVGEAAVGKEIISNEIPEDYITSDLNQGKILPRFRLIVPVIYNQEVSGVVVLESMTDFTPTQKRFVEEAIESVAIAFMTAQARSRVNQLLSQTRQQAEELQAQEEELRATNEELETQTESLRASSRRPNTSLGR